MDPSHAIAHAFQPTHNGPDINISGGGGSSYGGHVNVNAGATFHVGGGNDIGIHAGGAAAGIVHGPTQYGGLNGGVSFTHHFGGGPPSY